MMDWYKSAQAYNREIGYLNGYLKGGWDAWDFMYLLPEYFDQNEIEIKGDPDDFSEQWLNSATDKQKENFLEMVKRKHYIYESLDSPGYVHLEYQNFVRPTWLVHFTDVPWDIVNKGFIYGFSDFNGLGLTTHFTEKKRKSEPGYNFAFEEGSRGAIRAMQENKYGRNAVVFWSSGVKAYHSGDDENQIMFYGPGVDKNMIFPVIRSDGEWICYSPSDRVLFKSDDFSRTTDWVTQNHRMLMNIFSNR